MEGRHGLPRLNVEPVTKSVQVRACVHPVSRTYPCAVSEQRPAEAGAERDSEPGKSQPVGSQRRSAVGRAVLAGIVAGGLAGALAAIPETAGAGNEIRRFFASGSTG